MENNNRADGRVKLLIVSTDMHIGGVTTALLSLLNTLDYSRFQVDLLLNDHGGPLQGEIPDQVRLLPPAQAPNSLKKLMSPGYILDRLRALWVTKVCRRPNEGLQIRARRGAKYSRRLDGEYDLAISYIEFWPLYYVARYVKARHKIAWIHTDYQIRAINIKYDAPFFPCYDRIVFVAKEAAREFRSRPKAYASLGTFLPNIMSEALVRSRGMQPPQQKLDRGRLRLITVARVTFFQKAQDRALRAFDSLRREGKLEGVVWYILGEGPDLEALRAQIREFGRQDEVILLGSTISPLPLVRQCDAFFLPSVFEGKPVAATEAQMLGLPLLLTNFTSAHSVVENGVDGLIVDNDEAGIRAGLESLCETPGLLEKLRENTRSRHYGNEADIALYYDLWAQLGVLERPSEPAAKG